MLKPKKSEITIPGSAIPTSPNRARHRLMHSWSLSSWGFLGEVSTAVQMFTISKSNYPWIYLAS